MKSDFHREVARLVRALPEIAIDASDRELDLHMRGQIRPPPRAGTDTPERQTPRPPRAGTEAWPPVLLAEELLDADEVADAIALLLAVVDLRPNDIPSRALLRYAAAQRLGESRAPLRLAFAHMFLARAHARDDSRAVLYWCERVLARDPSDVATMVMESAHALRLGCVRAAAWIAYDALAARNDDRAALRAAIAAERARENFDAALALSERLAEVDPEDPDISRAMKGLGVERADREARRASSDATRAAKEDRKQAAEAPGVSRTGPAAAFETEKLGGKEAPADSWTTEPILLSDDEDTDDDSIVASPPPVGFRRAPPQEATRRGAVPDPAKRKRAAPPRAPAAAARPTPDEAADAIVPRDKAQAAVPDGLRKKLKAADMAAPKPVAPAPATTVAKKPAPVLATLPERKPVRFERWIADDAGRPGPIERLLGQSKLILRALRALVGLHLVAIAALADVVVDTATSYARGIQSAWLTFRTVQRRLARRGREAAALATDLAQARGQLWRLLRFRGELPPLELANRAPAAFDLELVLATRTHLDQMSRDLTLLTPRSAGAAAGKTIVGFLVSLIPNPFELASALKDWVILAFGARYDRRTVEAAYADLLAGTRQLVRLAERGSPTPDAALMALHAAEVHLLADHGLPQEPHEHGAIEPWIDEVETRLQRLIVALFSPARAMDPRHWSRADLVRELRHARARGVLAQAPLASECERWIVGLVRARWRDERERPSTFERALRRTEHLDRHARWREARRQLVRLV